MVATFAVAHRRRIHVLPGIYREPRQLVPEAVTWNRPMSLVHVGRLREIEVSVEDFEAAISEFCPEQRERIFRLSGLDPAPLPSPPPMQPVLPTILAHCLAAEKAAGAVSKKATPAKKAAKPPAKKVAAKKAAPKLVPLKAEPLAPEA